MVGSSILILSYLFLYRSRYLSSENDPSKVDMAEYETALKNAGCDLAPLTYVKK
jgi:hypothetical protein